VRDGRIRCCLARRDDLPLVIGNSSPQGVLNVAKSAGSRWRGSRRTLIRLHSLRENIAQVFPVLVFQHAWRRYTSVSAEPFGPMTLCSRQKSSPFWTNTAILCPFIFNDLLPVCKFWCFRFVSFRRVLFQCVHGLLRQPPLIDSLGVVRDYRQRFLAQNRGDLMRRATGLG
jgi:hypothetical protein